MVGYLCRFYMHSRLSALLQPPGGRRTLVKRILCIFFTLALSVFSASGEYLDGRYDLSPFVIRLTDGRLIHPGKPYAYQYAGIVQLYFLRGSFARISSVDGDYDAFYEVVEGDSDNITVDFRLRNGAVFRLLLVREGPQVFRYYYELEDPPFAPPPATDEKQEELSATPENGPAPGDVTVPPEEEAVTADTAKQPQTAEDNGPEQESKYERNIYTGVMKKHTEE